MSTHLNPEDSPPASHAELEFGYPVKSQMTDSELRNILRGVDGALDVYRKNEGKLNAMEISLKSMLMAVRIQLMAELAREHLLGAARK